MRRRIAVCAALAALAVPAPAGADNRSVQIVDTAYDPPQVSVLIGDTVGWRNSSFINQHTVTSGTFDSGPIVPGGGFFHDFTTPGAYAYACTIHPIMSGEVDVYGLLMVGPDQAVARGAATVLTGRASPGVGAISIEEDTGAGFHPVGSAQPDAGAFKATVHPPANATYRAVSGTDSSPPVQVNVSDRSAVTLKLSGGKLRAHVDPLNARARVSLQFKLRERFGWWTVARARLDRKSNARFTVRRRESVWARVVLTRSDGWTPLAQSAPLRVRDRRSAR
jgi:plastocyanin